LPRAFVGGAIRWSRAARARARECCKFTGRCQLASRVEITPRVETDLPQLFGLAHQTFSFLLGWYAIAERARSLHLVVEKSNHPARSFYTRSGFVPVEQELFALTLPQEPAAP
jgi:hypothetical protein